MPAFKKPNVSDLALQIINWPSRWLGRYHQHADLHYGPQAHQRLDLYLPKSARAEATALIIFIHGGSWSSGTKSQYTFVADAFTQAGYAVAIPDYIKHPAGVFPQFVDDIALACRWLSDNVSPYNIPQRQALIGHSAGAHTGALLISDKRYLSQAGLSPNTISHFVGLAGPYAFIPKEQRYRDVFANLTDFSQMQPLHFASGEEPPCLLLHGEKDETVKLSNTERYAKKINTLAQGEKTRVATHLYPQHGHVSIVLAFSRLSDRRNTVAQDILNFLNASDSETSIQTM